MTTLTSSITPRAKLLLVLLVCGLAAPALSYELLAPAEQHGFITVWPYLIAMWGFWSVWWYWRVETSSELDGIVQD